MNDVTAKRVVKKVAFGDSKWTGLDQLSFDFADIIPARDAWLWSRDLSMELGFPVVLAPANSFAARGYDKTREKVGFGYNANGVLIGVWKSRTFTQEKAHLRMREM